MHPKPVHDDGTREGRRWWKSGVGVTSPARLLHLPTLDPILLVPGITGSILYAVDDKTGKKERVWVRILGADHEFRKKLWSPFDPTTGSTVTLDADTRIEVPQDRYGLHAIDMLDPDMVSWNTGVPRSKV